MLMTSLSLAPRTPQVHQFIATLAQRFSLKDLGQLSFFLGVEAHHTSRGLFLSQQKYIRDLLTKANMLEATSLHSSVSTETLKLVDGSAPTDATQYRQIVGSLQYLSLTRPDVSFAVNKLSQFMHRPTTNHWNAVKRVLRYLKGLPQSWLTHCQLGNHLLIFMPLLTQTGQGILMTGGPLQPTSSFLAPHPSAGAPRSSTPSRAHPQRPNIVPLPLLQLS
jgi:hypothetical protein